MSLTPNGIDKFINNNPGVVLQIIDVIVPTTKKHQILTLSDGFSFVKDVVMTTQVKEEFQRENQGTPYLNLVIKVTEVKTIPTSKKSHYVLQLIQKVASLNERVGHPIPHEEYKKAGNVNPKGSNSYQHLAKQNNTAGNNRQRGNSINSAENIKKQQGQPSNKSPQVKQEYRSNNQADGMVQKTLGPKQPPAVKVVKQENSRTGPIQRVEKKQNSSSNHHNNQESSNTILVTDLYPGMPEDWKIRVRLISKGERKQIMTKKGKPSELMTMTFMDRKRNEITATLFNQAISRFLDILNIDEVYQISGAQVGTDNYTQTNKLTIGDNTQFTLVPNDSSIPFVSDLCVSLSDVYEMKPGDTAKVVCMISQEGPLQEFTSKNGKLLKKKLVCICDPGKRVELEITVWGHHAEMQFENIPYMISGLAVSEFKQQKQFSTGFKSSIEPQPDHSFAKYRDLSKIEFRRLNESSSRNTGGANGPGTITVVENLPTILDKSALLQQGKSIWSNARLKVSSIKSLPNTMMYLSCPDCKKKIPTEEAANCVHCGKYYPRGMYRYILQVQLNDPYSGIWATAYNEVGEQLLGISADNLHNLSVEEVKEVCHRVLNRDIKATLMSKVEVYMGENKVKHQLFKFQDVKFAEEAKAALALIRQYLYL